MIARLFGPTDGAVQRTETVDWPLLVATGAVGADGVVTGVAVTEDDAVVQPLVL